MYPHGRSLVKQYSSRPFALLGVNSDPDLEAIRRIVKEKDLPWRSFWNGPQGTAGPIAKQWFIRGWPTVFLIDHEGVIRYENLSGEKLDAAIEALVQEAEAASR